MEMEKVEAILARLRILALGGSDQAVIKYGKVAGLKADWANDKSQYTWYDQIGDHPPLNASVDDVIRASSGVDLKKRFLLAARKIIGVHGAE